MEQKLKMNDPVVITDGHHKGKLAYYIGPYPFPDGDPINPKSMVEIATPFMGKAPEKILLNDNQFLPINTEDVAEDAIKKAAEKATPTLTGPKFEVGDRVVVIDGNQRGAIANIQSVIDLGVAGLWDYEVGPFPIRGSEATCNWKIPEHHLRSWGSVDPPCVIDGFDVSKYLSLDLMKQIASQVYTEKVTSHVEEIIKRRTIGNTSLTDYCLQYVCSEFCEKLKSELQEPMLARMIEIIRDKDCTVEDDMTFNQMLSNSLAQWADKYIRDNLEKLKPAIEAKVAAGIDALVPAEIGAIIARKVDMKAIIMESLSEDKK